MNIHTRGKRSFAAHENQHRPQIRVFVKFIPCQAQHSCQQKSEIFIQLKNKPSCKTIRPITLAVIALTQRFSNINKPLPENYQWDHRQQYTCGQH